MRYGVAPRLGFEHITRWFDSAAEAVDYARALYRRWYIFGRTGVLIVYQDDGSV